MILNVQKPVLQHAETISEQRLNCLTHALGALLSLAGLIVMVCLSAINGSVRQIVTVSLFGAALLLVYVASTIYHACPVGPIKQRLQILDHCAIYFLIAGTYTPFLLVSVGGGWGWSLSGALWGLALIGVAFKLLYTGRFDLISSLIYIAMGWSGLIAIQPLLQTFPAAPSVGSSLVVSPIPLASFFICGIVCHLTTPSGIYLCWRAAYAIFWRCFFMLYSFEPAAVARWFIASGAPV